MPRWAAPRRRHSAACPGVILAYLCVDRLHAVSLRRRDSSSDDRGRSARVLADQVSAQLAGSAVLFARPEVAWLGAAARGARGRAPHRVEAADVPAISATNSSCKAGR
jgi:hypothetical protein